MSDETPRRMPERSDIIIRNAIKKALFTRKEPKKPTGVETEAAKPNPMLKRFGSHEMQPAPVIPRIDPETTPAAPVNAPAAPVKKEMETTIDPALLALITAEEDEKKALRTEPLPPVRLTPKKSFWATLKSKLVLPFTSRVSRKKKEMKTGLTNRQRIKRYNSIHEGDRYAPSSTVGADNKN